MATGARAASARASPLDSAAARAPEAALESLATQALVVFVIRTRRSPFTRSRPSRPLLVTTLAVVAVGIFLPYSPLAHVLGFRPLPMLFLGILAGLAGTYLLLAEVGKSYFFRHDRRRADVDAGARTVRSRPQRASGTTRM